MFGLIKIFELTDLKGDMKGLEVKRISVKLYAPKGSYKESYIELENGSQYPSSLVRRYEDYFDKVKD